MRGLIDGGSDLILLETIFDTLNAKAGIVAIENVFAEKGVRLPLMISFTITDKSGRTLSGQTLEAFYTSVRHAHPFSIGINCALGARDMRPYLADLARIAECYVSSYPNAGLPNAFGQYDELPAETSELVQDFATSGFVNIVGGCCGTTPDHIAAIATAVEGDSAARRGARGGDAVSPSRPSCQGWNRWSSGPTRNFQMVGERTNVTGLGEVRAADQGGQLHRGGDGRARPGPRRRQHHRRQRRRRHARLRAGDDDVPQLHRDGAGDRARADHDRQLQVDRARGGPEVRPGQGGRQLDQPQGRGSGLPREGAQDPALRRRRRRHGVRRDRPGRHGRAEGRDLHARLHAADRAGRLRSVRHHLRPEHPRHRHRARGAQRLRRELHRGDAHPQGDAARASRSAAASATCRSPSAATTSSAKRCTRRSCSTRSRRAWTWASSTPGSSSSTRTSRRICSSTSRT